MSVSRYLANQMRRSMNKVARRRQHTKELKPRTRLPVVGVRSQSGVVSDVAPPP